MFQDKENFLHKSSSLKMKNLIYSEQKGKRDANKATLRRTLRRRVSMSVMRSKMRRLQDYSLPSQSDNVRFLHAISDYCNSPVLGLRGNKRFKVGNVTLCLLHSIIQGTLSGI